MKAQTNYSQYFKVDTRKSNGVEFIKLVGDAPEELRAFVMELHGDCLQTPLPSDWIYRIAMEAFEELEQQDLDDITIESDCYYSDLREWLNESFAHGYCNEALENCGDLKEFYSIVAHAQYLAKNEIYNAVNDFINR